MSPLVVIDVLPPEPPGQHTLQMVAACTRALRAGECALSNATAESARPESIAIVSWHEGADQEGASVRVSQRDRAWVTRHLTFAKEDPAEARWTTIGLTIATLVDELAPSAEPHHDVAAPAQTAASRRPRSTTAAGLADGTGSGEPDAPAQLELALTVGALTGPGWQGGGWQRGVVSVFRIRRRDLPFVALARASYALSDGPKLDEVDSHTRWYTASLGVGVQLASDALDAGIVAALELTGQRATTTVRADSGSGQNVHAALRLQLAWPVRSSFGLAVGGTIAVPPLDPDADEDSASLRESVASPEAFAGVELRL